MLNPGYTTLSKFLIEQVPDGSYARDLAALLIDVAAIIKALSAAIGKGALVELSGLAGPGERPHMEKEPLAQIADEYFIRGIEWSGLVGALASERMESVRFVRGRGRLALLFVPLDAADHLDLNQPVGSVFSVLVLPEGARETAAVLQPGHCQIAAGYAIYGPCTQLVLTVGQGTHGFTLDREIGNFVLTHRDIRIPSDGSEYLINDSNRRFWEPPILRYVDECKAGQEGPRGRDFNTRWMASTGADMHRILMRGGVYLYPRDQRETCRAGRRWLLFEANPLAFLIEQAGGIASTGRRRILDEPLQDLHQRTPMIAGAADEVARVVRYHEEYDRGDDQPYTSQLFGERSLFVDC